MHTISTKQSNITHRLVLESHDKPKTLKRRVSVSFWLHSTVLFVAKVPRFADNIMKISVSIIDRDETLKRTIIVMKIFESYPHHESTHTENHS